MYATVQDTVEYICYSAKDTVECIYYSAIDTVECIYYSEIGTVEYIYYNIKDTVDDVTIPPYRTLIEKVPRHTSKTFMEKVLPLKHQWRKSHRTKQKRLTI